MNKPFIVCHMMTSIDSRIDCAMCEKLSGNDEYYKTLESYNCDSYLNGRYTAEIEMSHDGKFISSNNLKLNKIDFKKNNNTNKFQIICDTNGLLKYINESSNLPYLIIVSENVSIEFINYLNTNNISWVACGKKKINLNKALDILYNEFNIKSIALTGGAKLNTSFLEENLIDEISILIGSGIDARSSYPTLFDSRSVDSNIIKLKLKDCKKLNDCVWLKYTVK